MAILYQVYYRITGATNWIPFGTAVGANSVTVTGLSPAVAYDFEVVASNTFAVAASTTVTAATTTTGGTPPSGSVGGSQATGTSNPIVSGPTSGTVLKSAVLPMPGITIADIAVTPSPSPSNLNYAGQTPAIIDAAGESWTLIAGLLIQVNGVTDTTAVNPQQIVYQNGVVFFQDTSNAWRYKIYAAQSWTNAIGDPRTTAGSPVGPTPTLTITTTAGTIATNIGAGNLPGSGTTTITYIGTLANMQTAVANLALTAPGVVTSANVKVTYINGIGASGSITIPVGVITPTAPSAPTGLTVR